jgi:hypothetical protein
MGRFGELPVSWRDRRTWGTTPAERARAYPCDRFLPGAGDAVHRGIDVAAPPAVVFRWLCQLRAAPYSYDTLDNFGRRSPQTLTPGLEQLALGQRFMTIFDLVEFEHDAHVTLKIEHWRRVFGDGAVTYLIVPDDRDPGRCRLLVKILIGHRRPLGPLRRLSRELMPLGELTMMRRQLLNLRDLAQGTAGRSP